MYICMHGYITVIAAAYWSLAVVIMLRPSENISTIAGHWMFQHITLKDQSTN